MNSLPRELRLSLLLTFAFATVLPVIALVRCADAATSIGLYADPAGSSCSLSGNSPGLFTTYVVVRPDEFGVRAVQFAAVIPPCLGATHVGDNVPAGMLAIGSSPAGITIALQTCRFGVTNVLQITYLRSGDTAPCCEFSLVADPVQDKFVAVSCGYQVLPLTSVASHFNADASCACVGNGAPRTPIYPTPYDGETGVSVGTSFGWEASDPDGNLAEFDLYLGTTPSPPLVASELAQPAYTPAAPLAELTQHYWRVVARDALGLETSSATWTFTTRALNSPPYPPQNPSPTNAASGVNLTGVTLRWLGADIDGDILTYDVYFGTSTPPPLVAADVALSGYVLGTLSFDTVYYWRIVARDPLQQETSSPIWWFETRPSNLPPNPPVALAPANGAQGVSLTASLQWAASDNDGDALEFDVYFGTELPLPLVASNLTTTTYAPAGMTFSSYYYWQIVVRDHRGGETVGPLWTFTTRPENLPPVAPFGPSPATGAVIISQTPTLTWQCSDPDGHALTYDVYFGSGTSVPLVATDVTTPSYAPGVLSPNSLSYRWRIVARDALGAETTGPTWLFLVQDNSPPRVPTNPTPPDNSLNRSVNTILSWFCSDPQGQTLTYDVYFGTSTTPPLVATNVSNNSYWPGLLAFETAYRWQIVARDTGGLERAGPVWTFTTGLNSPPNAPSNPNPPNHGMAPPTPVLTWDGGDPDFQPLSYDVYFGSTSPPPLAASGLTVRSFAPGTLPLGQYFWRVVASDGSLSTSGPTWDFGVAQLGDANLDGAITLQDASCALGSFVQSGPCTMGGPIADVDCSGAVTPADARCIHKFVLDGSCDFCGVPASTAPGDVQTPMVSVGATWESDDTVYVRLMVSGVPSLRAFGFTVFSQADNVIAVRRGATSNFVELRIGSYSTVGIVGAYSLSGAYADTPVDFIELRFYAAYWYDRFAFISSFVDDLAGAYPLSFYLDGGGSLPVLITRFDATVVDGGVEVRWELRSDEAVESFTLYRREDGAGLPIEVAHGPAGTASQSYLDTSVEGGKTYHYELLIRTVAGGEFRSQAATVSTHALALTLGQNHPNPFNPQTTIPYDLPHSDRRERVRLWILDISGRVVTTLVDEEQGGGSYRVTWQGRDNRGEAVSSGVYFYVLDVGGQRRTKKLVLLK